MSSIWKNERSYYEIRDISQKPSNRLLSLSLYLSHFLGLSFSLSFSHSFCLSLSGSHLLSLSLTHTHTFFLYYFLLCFQRVCHTSSSFFKKPRKHSRPLFSSHSLSVSLSLSSLVFYIKSQELFSTFEEPSLLPLLPLSLLFFLSLFSHFQFSSSFILSLFPALSWPFLLFQALPISLD